MNRLPRLSVTYALRHGQRFFFHPDTELARLVRIEGKCRFTGCKYDTAYYDEDALLEGLALWADGMVIQKALRLMSSEDREFIISGISPDGWKLLEKTED